MSDTKQGLQNSLNQLEAYCEKCKLSVNVSKTKVVIFRNGGSLGQEMFV